MKCIKCGKEYDEKHGNCPYCQDELTGCEKRDETPLFSKTGKFGEKVVANEKSNHIIYNSVILLFLVVIMALCFISGVSFTVYGNELGSVVDVPHNIIQVIDADLSMFAKDSDEFNKFFDSIEEEWTATVVDWAQMLESGIPASKIGIYLSRRHNVNFMKVYTWEYVLSGNSGTQEDEFYELTLLGSIKVSFAVVLVQAIILVVALTSSIKTITALIKRKPVKIVKSALVIVAFLLAKISVSSVAPLVSIDPAGIAMIVIGILLILFLCAYEILFARTFSKENIMPIIKNLTIAALGLVACFVLFGNILNFMHNGEKYGLRAGKSVIWLFNSIISDNSMANGALLFLAEYVLYLPCVILTATLAFYLIRNLCGELINSSHKYGTRTMVLMVFSMIFVALLNGAIIFLSNEMFNAGYYGEMKPSVTAETVISMICCIAIIVIRFAWKIKPTTETEDI